MKQFWEVTKGFWVTKSNKATEARSSQAPAGMLMLVSAFAHGYFRGDLIFAEIAANVLRPNSIVQKMLMYIPVSGASSSGAALRYQEI